MIEECKINDLIRGKVSKNIKKKTYYFCQHDENDCKALHQIMPNP